MSIQMREQLFLLSSREGKLRLHIVVTLQRKLEMSINFPVEWQTCQEHFRWGETTSYKYQKHKSGQHIWKQWLVKHSKIFCKQFRKQLYFVSDVKDGLGEEELSGRGTLANYPWWYPKWGLRTWKRSVGMARTDISETETIGLNPERGRSYLISRLGNWGNSNCISK